MQAGPKSAYGFSRFFSRFPGEMIFTAGTGYPAYD
jgi:hypothetical protein